MVKSLIGRLKFKRLINKIIAVQLLIVILLSTVLIGYGSSNIKTVNAYRVAHSPSSPKDAAWASIPGTKIQLGSDDLTGGHGRPDLTQTPDITIKAAYNENDLYMFLRWKDGDVDNIHSYWEFKDGAWAKHEPEVNHDRLYMAWAITDTIGKGGETFASKGCAMSCHKFNTANNNFVAMAEGQNNINRCGSCHSNSGIKLAGFKHTTDEGDGTCSAVACHGGQDRSFNSQATVDGAPVTVGADHVLPDSIGKLDIWHWKASNGANGYMDDQVVANAKKRTNDGASAIDYYNRNASSNDTHPLKIWPLGQEKPLNYVATKRDYNNSMIALSTLDPTKLADGVTDVPEGTLVRRHLSNNLDATTTNLDIKSQFRRVNGYYEMVLTRRLDTGDPNDYQFTDLESDHIFSIAAIDQSDVNHAGSALQSLNFVTDTKAPVTTLTAPVLSTDSSNTMNFDVSWSANDGIVGSGVEDYDIKYRKAGTSEWSNWLAGTGAEDSVFGLSKDPISLKPGDIIELKARARDTAGNQSTWSAISKTVVPINDNAFSYSGTWTSETSSANHFQGSAKATNAAGGQATVKVTGKGFTIIGPKGSNMGKMHILIDGKLVKTVDQYSSTAKYRQKLFTKTWSTTGIREVKVIYSGTKNASSSGKKIAIDGIAMLK